MLKDNSLQNTFDARNYNQTENKKILQIAHDIISPIAVMQILVDNIKDSVSSNTFNSMNMAIDRIRSITHELLDKNKDNIKPIFLSDIIKNIVQEKYYEWQKNPCIIKINISSKVSQVPLHINRNILICMLSNLLNNAYDSLKNNRKILITLGSNKSYLILKIRDYGCGIEKNDLKLITKGFSTKEKGYGLGLSGALRFIKSINGKLHIESQIDYGTEVCLKFPY